MRARQIIGRDFSGLAVLILAVLPVIGLRTSMPSITTIPATANARVSYQQVTSAFGPGFPGTLQVLVPSGRQAGTGQPHARRVRDDRRAGFPPAPGRSRRPPDRLRRRARHAKERYETHADPERSLVGSVRTSGRVVVSAAAVMIAVFLTFALSGPLAPKEMG